MKHATIEDLRKPGQHEVFISLGQLRSSKDIYTTGDGTYEIFHNIDGTVENLTEAELLEETNIGRALEKKALYYHV